MINYQDEEYGYYSDLYKPPFFSQVVSSSTIANLNLRR